MEVTIVAQLVDALQNSSVTELCLTGPDFCLRLTAEGLVVGTRNVDAALPSKTPARIESDGHGTAIRASRPGTFASRHPSLAEPYLQTSRTVHAGDILGLLRFGPFFSLVRSSAAGSVGLPEKRDGEPASYDERLFVLDETHRNQP